MEILIIEDEVKMAQTIKKGLEESGFAVDVSNDGKEGFTKAQKNPYKLIICDVMLPSMNGRQITSSLRKNHVDTPLLMLTALSTTDDLLAGFESGADDYISKPFEFRELLARVKAILKRSNLDINSKNNNIVKVADLVLNLELKTIERRGKLIDLTAREFDLVVYMIENKNKVISKKEIAEAVWDIHFDTGTNIIEVYVNYVRKKIDKDFDTKLIHTVHGRGYMLKDSNYAD